MNWPDDADGDVLRRLQEHDFNFENIAKIEFDIDFDHWPLNNKEKELINKNYPNCEIIDPDEEDLNEGRDIGYISYLLETKLTYEVITETQDKITEELKPIGGHCNTWGVLMP